MSKGASLNSEAELTKETSDPLNWKSMTAHHGPFSGDFGVVDKGMHVQAVEPHVSRLRFTKLRSPVNDNVTNMAHRSQ